MAKKEKVASTQNHLDIEDVRDGLGHDLGLRIGDVGSGDIGLRLVWPTWRLMGKAGVHSQYPNLQRSHWLHSPSNMMPPISN